MTRKKKKHILLIGESITFGNVAGGGIQNSWAYLLACATRALGWTVSNVAQPGSGALDWSPEYRWSSGAPDVVVEGRDEREEIVVISLGGGDALGFATLPPRTSTRPLEYGAAMDDLIAHLRKRDRKRKIMLNAPVNVPFLLGSDPFNGYITAYRSYCWDKLAREGRRTMQCVEPEMMPSDYNGTDIHPNAQGHHKIYESVLIGLGEWL